MTSSKPLEVAVTKQASHKNQKQPRKVDFKLKSMKMPTSPSKMTKPNKCFSKMWWKMKTRWQLLPRPKTWVRNHQWPLMMPKKRSNTLRKELYNNLTRYTKPTQLFSNYLVRILRRIRSRKSYQSYKLTRKEVESKVLPRLSMTMKRMTRRLPSMPLPTTTHRSLYLPACSMQSRMRMTKRKWTLTWRILKMSK